MDLKVRTHVLSSEATTFQGAYEMALSIHASIMEGEAMRVVTVQKHAVNYRVRPRSRGMTVEKHGFSCWQKL